MYDKILQLNYTKIKIKIRKKFDNIKMDLCSIALVLLLAAFVFYLIISLCCKKEKFCPGSAVVRNNRSGYYPGAGRSVLGQSDCPERGSGVNSSYRKQYAHPNYVIEGMDTPQQVAQFVANKTLKNLMRQRSPCANPDNKFPAGNPMAIARGGSNDGRMSITGEQLQKLESSLNELDKENVQNFYENFEENENTDKENFNEELTEEVAPCGEDSCGLPETMFNEKCADPNTYVYDRQISVVAKSRSYGLGNYLLGDLPICPAVFKDQYGHNIMTPSARPSADLNAGALRFLSGTEVNITNLSGDVQAYRSGDQSNVAVQYSLAG